MPLTKTDVNVWTAFIDESKASQLYVAYAIRAMEEGHPEVAQIFMEASGAESVHALSHLKVVNEVKSTVENLVTVIHEEGKEADTVYPRRIREAELEGRKQAVNSFTMAWQRERHHMEAMQEALDGLLQKQPDLRPQAQQAIRRLQGEDAEREAEALPADLVEQSEQVPPQVRTEVFEEKARVGSLQRLREVIFGAQDGLVSTVAVVSSLALASGESGIVIIAGATSALAGMVSMAAGSFLGSRAEQDVQTAELEFEAREIREHPAEEMAELITIYQREGMSYDEAIRLAERVAADRQLWLSTMADKELGLSTAPQASPVQDSVTMGLSFILGAIFPMLPYFFMPARVAVLPSLALTLIVLFLVGVGKGKLLHKHPLLSGLEVMGVGSVSGGLGYLLGVLLPKLFGVAPGLD